MRSCLLTSSVRGLQLNRLQEAAWRSNLGLSRKRTFRLYFGALARSSGEPGAVRCSASGRYRDGNFDSTITILGKSTGAAGAHCLKKRNTVTQECDYTDPVTDKGFNMQVLVWHKKPQENPMIMKQRRNTFSHCRQILPDMKAFVLGFQSMPDVQNLALQHSQTNTIPAVLFNLRASATRVMNPISTDSIHKLSAGGHSSAVDWHPGCPRNPFTRLRGYPGRGRKMRKRAVPFSSLC